MPQVISSTRTLGIRDYLSHQRFDPEIPIEESVRFFFRSNGHKVQILAELI
jgi:hypothetical protein